MTAVANCQVAQTPLVVIGGARPLVQAEQRALQELDQLSLLHPITKWAAVCTQTERIPEFVATAFRQALAQPRGPVYLELPMDVLFADAPAEHVGRSRTDARAFGDPRKVMKAAALLSDAERPAVIAGSGIWWDGAWKQLASEIESGAAPLNHYRLGKILDEVLDPSTVVIGDGGDVVAAVSRVLRVHWPGIGSIPAHSRASASGRPTRWA